MQPYPISDSDSLELAFAGPVKAGFPSPAEEVREKLDLVKLLVQHSASTFFFRIDGISMVDADMDEGDIIIVDRGIDPYNVQTHTRRPGQRLPHLGRRHLGHQEGVT